MAPYSPPPGAARARPMVPRLPRPMVPSPVPPPPVPEPTRPKPLAPYASPTSVPTRPPSTSSASRPRAESRPKIEAMAPIWPLRRMPSTPDLSAASLAASLASLMSVFVGGPLMAKILFLCLRVLLAHLAFGLPWRACPPAVLLLLLLLQPVGDLLGLLLLGLERNLARRWSFMNASSDSDFGSGGTEKISAMNRPTRRTRRRCRTACPSRRSAAPGNCSSFSWPSWAS